MAGATSAQPVVRGFFDRASQTISYVVADPETKCAAIVDPVLDFDPASCRTATNSADAIAEHVEGEGLRVEWLLETHAHADHLSAAPYLKRRLGGRIAIGEHITAVQTAFKAIYNAGPDFTPDGSQFDHLFKDGDRFRLGSLDGTALHTPGHTPACVSYVIGDAAFVGDTLFMPDYGTARCDFPGGDAALLYRSIHRLYRLPGETRLFVCHDYMPGGRPPQWETTVAEQRAANVHIREGVGEDEFVRMRTARDKTLSMPALILPAVQVNMRAGRFPPPEENGVRYLKLPVDRL